MQEILLGGLLILAAVWLVMRIRQRNPEVKAPPIKTDNSGAYHAVAIKYSANACDAAKAMTGRRFLSSAAPRLPLPDCDFPDCRCMFVHYKDRRSGEDRRSPFGSGSGHGFTGSYERTKRVRTDRRKQTEEEENEDFF